MNNQFVLSICLAFAFLLASFASSARAAARVENGYYQVDRIDPRMCGYNVENLPGDRLRMRSWYCAGAVFDQTYEFSPSTGEYVGTSYAMITQNEVDECKRRQSGSWCIKELHRDGKFLAVAGDVLEGKGFIEPYSSTFFIIARGEFTLLRSKKPVTSFSRKGNRSYLKAAEIQR